MALQHGAYCLGCCWLLMLLVTVCSRCHELDVDYWSGCVSSGAQAAVRCIMWCLRRSVRGNMRIDDCTPTSATPLGLYSLDQQ